MWPCQRTNPNQTRVCEHARECTRPCQTIGAQDPATGAEGRWTGICFSTLFWLPSFGNTPAMPNRARDALGASALVLAASAVAAASWVVTTAPRRTTALRSPRSTGADVVRGLPILFERRTSMGRARGWQVAFEESAGTLETAGEPAEWARPASWRDRRRPRGLGQAYNEKFYSSTCKVA